MNSTAGSTPTVPKVLRVTELKKVFGNSQSGSGSIISSKRRLMLDQTARSCTSSPRRVRISSTVPCTYFSYSSMRSTASFWLPRQSRASKRCRARCVIARNSAL